MVQLRTTVGLAFATSLALAGAAPASLVYSNDFQNATPGSEWANGRYTSATPFTQFMGRYGTTDSTTLSLTPLTPPSVPNGGGGGGGGGGSQYYLYNVTFDFFAIDSWDGTNPATGPDMFEVKINGNVLFNQAFSNYSQNLYQTFRAPDVGPSPMAFNVNDADSIYRDISVDFTVDPAATVIQIKFRGALSQPITDESWGIDNVRVNATLVPTPGSVALLAMGGLLASRRKRR